MKKGFFMMGPIRFIDVKGLLKYVILYIIGKKPMHGYGIIQLISEISQGLYTPSPGAIYPTLQYLEEGGLIKAEEKDGKKIYSITERGRGVLKEHEEEVKEIIEKSMRMKELMSDLNLKALINAIKEVFKALPYLKREEKEEIGKILEESSKKIFEVLRREKHEGRGDSD